MCEYCHSYPHLSGCPYEPEPESIGECVLCGEKIVVGDEYYDFQDDFYHEDCFREVAADIMLDYCYVSKHTA